MIDLKNSRTDKQENHWEMESNPESIKGIIEKMRKGISFIFWGKVSNTNSQISWRGGKGKGGKCLAKQEAPICGWISCTTFSIIKNKAWYLQWSTGDEFQIIYKNSITNATSDTRELIWEKNPCILI